MGEVKAVKAFIEAQNNGGNMGKAMIKAGYKPSTARNPKQLLESNAWQKLMEQHLSDKLLATKHNELLNAERIKRVYLKGDLQTEIEEMDADAVGRGLDMAYKLKGKYSAQKHEVQVVQPIIET